MTAPTEVLSEGEAHAMLHKAMDWGDVDRDVHECLGACPSIVPLLLSVARTAREAGEREAVDRVRALAGDHSPGPWRRGGQCKFDGENIVELKTGTDIWAADGSAVTEFSDIFCDADIELMVAAPALLADINQARAALAERERELDQALVRLAGCGVAALGYMEGQYAIDRTAYGWSASYEDVVTLRRKFEAAEAALATARGALDVTERVLKASPGDMLAVGELLRKDVSNGHFGWWLAGGGFVSLNNAIAQERAALPAPGTQAAGPATDTKERP